MCNLILFSGRALDIVRAFHMVNYINVALQEVRDEVDSYQSQWFQQAVNLAREVGTKPSVPRTFKKQTQRDNTESSCAEEYYRRTLTIPFVDHLNTELEARFSDLQQKASLGLLLLPPSAEHASELTDKLDYFSEDLPSPNTIKQEIHMWNLKWNNSNMMKPDTLEKALKECDQSFFPNINAILRICCVFPVTSAECERSISVLRLIKNYLRSTMGQERVSALCLMFIHRDINIDPTEVVTIFSQRNPRRMLLPDVLCDPR